jgi:hypothetical protein
MYGWVGSFADPRYQDVPNLADVGYPIAQVAASGEDIRVLTPSCANIVG